MKGSVTSRFLASLAAMVTAMACTLVPCPAKADPVEDAKDLFTRGRELRTHNDCGSAAPLFRKAYELYPAGLGSLRNLAECEEYLGHYASSRRAWLDLSRALLTFPDRKYDGWDKDAADAAARLAPKLATVTIDLNLVGPGGEAQSSRGVEVTLDAEKVAASLLGTPLERDPGRHTVRVTGDRVQGTAERAVDLAAGDAKRVALRVVVTPDAPPPPEVPGATPLPGTPPTEADDAERARATKRTVGWTAIGVGAAGLLGAGISLGIRQSALGDVNHSCPSHAECDPNLQPTVSRGEAASIAFDVLGILGLVGVGSGLALLATSGHPQQARLVVTPTLGGASAVWTF